MRAAIFSSSHPWQAFLFFLQNLTLNGPGFDTLRVTWSLAIEEQFYLVWPIIVWLAPRRILKPLALSALFLSVAIRWSVVIGLIPPLNTYTNTLARLDGLGLGAFLALWIPESESRTVKWAGIGLIACAVPATIAVGLLHSGHWSFYALVSCCFAGLLCVAINTPQLAGFEFLKYTGKISYALYLVHVPLFDLANSAVSRRLLGLHSLVWSDVVVLVISFALCYGLAAASWRFYESKFLKLKSKFKFHTASAPQLSYSANGPEN